MAIFTIGDLHLSLGTNKPMDEFKGWNNYVARIEENWKSCVQEGDVVVLAGDLSWGMSLAESKNDFAFVDKLPGKKILIKGNHDYWWSTANKMQNFFTQNGFNTLNIMNNNCYIENGIALCGTRSWLFENGEEKDMKIINREKGRLLASLQQARVKNASEIIAFLHYPPISKSEKAEEMISVLQEFGVKECYYGHLHGASIKNAVQGQINGVNYKLISADSLNFKPYKIR